jgi:hypothetical protein
MSSELNHSKYGVTFLLPKHWHFETLYILAKTYCNIIQQYARMSENIHVWLPPCRSLVNTKTKLSLQRICADA